MNGTQTEFKTNLNGIQTEFKSTFERNLNGIWNGIGTKLERKTELERNWNLIITEFEHNLNGIGTEFKQNLNLDTAEGNSKTYKGGCDYLLKWFRKEINSVT